VIIIKKVYINGVKKNSIAEEIGLKKGDYIISINGQEIFDILDYKFIVEDEYIELEIEHEDGEIEIFEIEKEEDDDLGIEFEHELIDKPKNCHNKCIFCFMEQLPENVRDTLIFKDDDYRLSFFSGNYITLTNLKEFDIQRIIKYRLSPINISIHATDEKVRCMMLNNRFAGKVLEYLDRFYEAGIVINTQIVLCKGINDGKILQKTIRDLSKYIPVLKSICIVPVGITKNREGLYPLETLTKEDCKNTIELVRPFQEEFKKMYKVPVVYLADEFYLKANEKFPAYKDYLDFSQIEDGIGMIALFDYEFEKEIKKIKNQIISGKKDVNKVNKTVTLITGKITEDYIKEKAKVLERIFTNLKINVLAITNDYFGNEITVTGLITGRDIISTIDKLNKDSFNLDIFLDDTLLVDVQEKLNLKIVVSDGTASGFIKAIINKIPNRKIYKFSNKQQRQSYENSIYH
jgi:putative radical SAM enzyme (TIGR03279 family)